MDQYHIPTIRRINEHLRNDGNVRRSNGLNAAMLSKHDSSGGSP